jgi:hypothetical protein
MDRRGKWPTHATIPRDWTMLEAPGDTMEVAKCRPVKKIDSTTCWRAAYTGRRRISWHWDGWLQKGASSPLLHRYVKLEMNWNANWMKKGWWDENPGLHALYKKFRIESGTNGFEKMCSTWNAAQRGKQILLPCGVSDRYLGTQL